MSGHGHESHGGGGGGGSSEGYFSSVEKLAQVAPESLVAAGGFALFLEIITGMVRSFGGQA